MKESTHELVVESSDWHQDQTAHGLLVLAHAYATEIGFFTGLKRSVSLPIKTVTYTVHDKLATLWASILADCDHTVEINTKLGRHEQALAGVFGLERFPDQSTINRLLCACTSETVEALRRLHLQLVTRYSRARRPCMRRKLLRGRVLYVDVDQRGITVSGKHYELAAPGYFTRKRSRRGYQLSVAFLGGLLGEVLDEYFDPGNTSAASRLDDLLSSVEHVARAWGLAPEQIIIRADAEYGTGANIAAIQARGFGFLLKGISTKRARCFGEALDESAFEPVTPRCEGEPRWVADLGECEFTIESGQRTKPKPTVRARAVLVKWIDVAVPGPPRPGPTSRARRAEHPRPSRTCYAMLLTSLAAEVLPAVMAVDEYDDRATIERYFRDEQCALGARSVRTHKAAGAAVFQWMVAMTNNLLHWMRARYFRETPLEHYGASRLVKRAFQVPARLIRSQRRLRVVFPERHALAAMILDALARNTSMLSPTAIAPPGSTQ